MGVILGVDGGNTKCDYLLFSEDGTFMDHLRAGTASHEQMPDGYEGAQREMGGQVTALLSRHGLTLGDVKASAWGLAGVDTLGQKQALEKAISSLGFARHAVMNDGFLGIKAGSLTGAGVCSINGTGTVTCGIDRHGNWLQVGGVGDLSGDEAGSGYISRRTLRVVYDSLYRLGAPTGLKQALFDLLGIVDPADYVSAVYGQVYSHRIPPLSVLTCLYDQAEAGDAAALSVLDEVAQGLARSAAGCINALDFEGTVPLVLAGSVWVKSRIDTMVQRFSAHLAGFTRQPFTLTKLSVPPAAGAILWALELAHGQVPQASLRQKVLDSLVALL